MITDKPPPPMSEEERALFEERAAIREFMGGMSREKAEAAALEDVRRILATEQEDPKP